MRGEAEERVGEAGVGEAGGEGGGMEAHRGWHWKVRPRNTGEVLATSRGRSHLGRLLNVLLELLHVSFELGPPVLEPANYLEYQNVFEQ